MAQVELTVPDLGGFSDIPVIEVLVKAGDTVQKETPLVTLESDKATMEVPASEAGVVKDIKVKVGDKVSQGSILVTVDSGATAGAAATGAKAAAANDGAANAAAGAAAPSEKQAAANEAGAANAGATEEAAAQAAPATQQAAAQAQAAPANGGTVDLVVPDLGGFADVPVIEVLVKAGDTVQKETPLVTLESDKASMEVPAASGGTIRDVKVKVGDKVSPGTVIATVASSGGGASASGSSANGGGGAASGANGGGAAASGANGGGAAASGANGGGATLRQAQGDTTQGTATLRQAQGDMQAPAAAEAPSGAPVHASPAIRRFARELGVAIARVRGTGPNGRITRDDVQAFVKSSISAGASAAGASAAGAAGSSGGLGLNLPPWPKIDFAKFGPIERVALSRIQKISGPVLARNWVMIPHVTQNEDADVTELESFRKQINGERKDVKVTMLAFLIKAAIAALVRYPPFNASLDGEELVLKKYYNIGFAADTPNGLVVPVVKDADRKGIVELARETAELGGKARDGKLGPAEMTGATFTISSLGSIGGTTFTPIINAPEVAILGACRAETKPVWDGEAFVPRLIQPLSLSYDHRVIDGANAARFCVALKESLADLRRVLL